MKLFIKPSCFLGEPLDFLNWRVALARAAGYGIDLWEVDDVSFLVPQLDYDSLTHENVMGIWEHEPDDALMVLLAHSDEDGVIMPQHFTALIERLEGLMESLSEEDAFITERFIKGLQVAQKNNVAAVFDYKES